MTLLGRLRNAAVGVWNRLSSAMSTASTRVFRFGKTAAGVRVDADSALRQDTVWACVQYLSKTVAQLPWRVMRELPGGGYEPVQTSPVDWLIHKRPNPEMGSFNFRQTLMGWALIHGNGYAEIQRDNRGAAWAMWPIHPSRVQPRRYDDGTLYYEVRNAGGQAVEIAAMDMFHIRGFGDGVVGYSVWEFAAQTIGWAQATELFGASYFGEGMNPSGIVKLKSSMTIPGMELLREDLDRLYKGPRGNRTAILDNDADFVKVSTTPDESQFVESMQHQVEAICRWFGVPPHKVMHLLRATFSNIEHQSIEVVVDSITPWVKIWEEEADYKLFGANRLNLATKMNLRGLMRGDNASRAQYFKTMFEMGLPINAIMALEDMPGIGKDGDVSFVTQNVQTLERAIQGEPAKGALPPPADTTSDDSVDAADVTTAARPNAVRARQAH